MKGILLWAFMFIAANPIYAQASIDSALVKQLAIIRQEDQSVREIYEQLPGKYKADTTDLRAALRKQAAVMNITDSLNFIQVRKIIDTYGWPGPALVGQSGSSTIFLVVLHAGIDGQLKYLPLMRNAVKQGKAKGEDLALLEDRVLLSTGKRQLYGSQVGRDVATNEFYVQPLADPDNVDKRRALVGLEPLAAYISQWGMEWDAEQYKQQLPSLDNKHGIMPVKE